MSESKEQETLLNSETTLRTNKILKICSQITQTIMGLPSGEEYQYQLTTSKKAKKRVTKCNKKLSSMLSQLMIKTTREKDNHDEFNGLSAQVLLQKYHYVVDTADDLMEIANKSIDRYVKDKKSGDDYERELEKAFSLKNDSMPHISSRTSELIKRTKNYLVKPQLSFEPKMDNSYFQFVPILNHKENAKEPLDPRIKKLQEEYVEYLRNHPKIEFTMDCEIPFTAIPHPYETEIVELKINWKEMMKEVSQLSPSMPPPITETDFEFIDQEEQLDDFMKEINAVKELAIDLEYHAYRSYQGFTCLMQLSTRTKDYIVDTIALRSKLQCLNKVFTDPSIIKVLHGSKSDIVWLQKDLGVYVVNLFDTGEAAKVLGLKASLGFLLKHYCQVNADKKFQLADWRQRPLPEEMTGYAREDTHYLLYIYDVMRVELATPKNPGDNPVAFLRSVWKSSKELCLQTYQKPKAKDTEYFSIVSRNATLMGEGQMHTLEMLMVWRDYVSRVEDESTKFVMPNDVLFDLAKSTPINFQELQEVLRRHPKQTNHELVYKYEQDLLERINVIVKKYEEIIKQRVEDNRKKVMAYNNISESSSSDDEEPLTKKQAKTQQKPQPKNKKSAQVKIDVEESKADSKVFPNFKENKENERNLEKLRNFNSKIDLTSFMAVDKDKLPQAMKRPKVTEKEDQQCLPLTKETHNLIPQEELKDVVVKVDEVDVKNMNIAAEDQKIAEDSDGEFTKTLPPSMKEKYNIQRKDKNSRRKEKRMKTGEQTESQNSLLATNKKTAMTKISEMAKQVTDQVTNDDTVDKKQKGKEKKRHQKQMIKSNLESGNNLNPEKWDEALQTCEKAFNKEMRQTKRNNQKQAKGGRGGKGSKGGKGSAKGKNTKGKGQAKSSNRFAFLDKEV